MVTARQEVDEIRARVDRTLDPRDSMNQDSDTQYFDVGASACEAILAALRQAGRTPEQVGSVLDYACGYGRVARWLKAAFPDARLLCVDADVRAVDSVARTLSVTSRAADISLRTGLEASFDLIWMGSLITHLSAVDTAAVLAYLARHLTPQGVLVATMHGPYVAQRIRTADKLYGLQPDQVDALLSGYDTVGYGYGHYPHSEAYGISAATRDSMQRICDDAGLAILAAWEKRWANHQDVYVLAPRA